MYGSRAVNPLVLISDDVINRILKLDIQTNILVYVTRCCTDLTSKVLKESTFGQSSAVLIEKSVPRDQRLSSLASFVMPNGNPRDGIFYPTLTLIMNTYNIDFRIDSTSLASSLINCILTFICVIDV